MRDGCLDTPSTRGRRRLAALLPLLLAAGCHPTPSPKISDPVAAVPVRSPTLDAPSEDPSRRVYFGELHLHTLYSSDAVVYGTFIDPDAAYRYASGEPVATPTGETIRLRAPLDFMAVTDHSEWLGEVDIAIDPTSPWRANAFAARLRDSWKSEKVADEVMWNEIFGAEKSGVRIDMTGTGGQEERRAARALWRRTMDAAERHNRPGRFTTLLGFEWTATPDGNNIHRNLIFRGTDVPELPVSWFEARTVESLWDWMEQVAGGPNRVLAIPHNSNLSNGLMFEPVGSDGKPYDARSAERRRTLEPLVEIAQRKGTSESNASFAPNDEFIDFELMPADYTWSDKPAVKSRFNWAREGLKEGLLQAAKHGVNPFEFGFVGATDNHSGLGGDVNEKETIRDILRAGPQPMASMTSSAGALTAVWAEANTREHIWQALKRREAFATSGTRIAVRFFGGWGFRSGLLGAADWVKEADRNGVAMGSTLAAPGGRHGPPQFVFWARQDPDSAGLDRVQIVKGWVRGGRVYDKTIDVACSGGRQPDVATGRCPESAAGVRLSDCSLTGPAGAPELHAIWTDPDYARDEWAFYYVRVLESPTCRWTTWAALRRGESPPPKLPPVIRERAWTSPIWLAPVAGPIPVPGR